MKHYTFDYQTTPSNSIKADIDAAMISMNTVMLLAIADKCRSIGYKDCIHAIKSAMGIYHPQYGATPDCHEAEEALAELDACLERLASLVAGYESPYSYVGGALQTEELGKQLARAESKLDACYELIVCYYRTQKEKSEEDDSNW